MKKQLSLLAVLLVASFFVSGCASMTAAVPYSFAGDDNNTASIIMDRSVNLIHYDGMTLPKPERLTRWDPVLFPAGEKLLLRLHLTNDISIGGRVFAGIILLPFTVMMSVNASTNFYCPPLESGKEYRITLRPGFGTIGRRIVLTDARTRQVVFEQKF